MEYIRMEYKKDTPWGRYMSGDKSLAIGAKKDGELVAYAVFTTKEKDKEGIVLDYIYVIEKWRNQYVASNMLEYMEAKLRLSGYRYIVCQVLEHESIGCEMHNLLSGQGYSVYKDDAIMMQYQLSQMKASERMKKIGERCKTNKRIVRISRKNDNRYVRFMEKLYQKGIDLYSISFDCTYSFFYQDKTEEFQGCILIEKKETEVIVKYIYVDETKVEQTALLCLLWNAVKSVWNDDERMNISIYLMSQKYKDLLSYFFPESQAIYHIFDYVRWI